MRVVLASYGSRGDIEPLIALAMQLQESGNDVRICAPPDFAELIDADGIELVPAGWPVRALATGVLGGKAPASHAELAKSLTMMTYQAVASVAEGCDVVLATGSPMAAPGAQAAAEKLAVPYLYATFSPCVLPSPYQRPLPWPGQTMPAEETDNRALWDAQAQHLHGLFGEPVNAHRAALGLPPIDNVPDLIRTDHPLLAADRVLGPWQPTADLEVTQTGAWIRRDERPLPGPVQAFLDAGDPPVYVGFGSMPLDGMDRVSLPVTQAVRWHGRRILLGSGWADLAPIDDKDDCFVVGEVNQQALFRQVAAVVHHGGAGTTTTAALAGAPQVIVPQVADQPYWADRVADLGIGTRHDGSTPTAESLTDALDIALTPKTAETAATVAGTIRTDGTAQAAEFLARICR